MLIKTRTGKRSQGGKSRAPERVSGPRARPGRGEAGWSEAKVC